MFNGSRKEWLYGNKIKIQIVVNLDCCNAISLNCAYFHILICANTSPIIYNVLYNFIIISEKHRFY